MAIEMVRPEVVRFAMPLRTPPGPSSAKSVTPSDSRVTRLCRQRTGLDSCADSRLVQSDPRWWGLASTLETTGTSLSRGCAASIAVAEPLAGGGHEGGVERTRHLQRHHPLRAEVLGVSCGAVDAVGRAGDDDLAGSVVVGDPDVRVGEVAGDPHLVVVEPEDGGHRARLFDPASCIAAARSETRRIPSSNPSAPVAVERGVLAEAVARADACVDTDAADRVEDDQARHEGRQLRVAGVL